MSVKTLNTVMDNKREKEIHPEFGFARVRVISTTVCETNVNMKGQLHKGTSDHFNTDNTPNVSSVLSYLGCTRKNISYDYSNAPK